MKEKQFLKGILIALICAAVVLLGLIIYQLVSSSEQGINCLLLTGQSILFIAMGVITFAVSRYLKKQN